MSHLLPSDVASLKKKTKNVIWHRKSFNFWSEFFATKTQILTSFVVYRKYIKVKTQFWLDFLSLMTRKFLVHSESSEMEFLKKKKRFFSLKLNAFFLPDFLVPSELLPSPKESPSQRLSVKETWVWKKSLADAEKSEWQKVSLAAHSEERHWRNGSRVGKNS